MSMSIPSSYSHASSRSSLSLPGMHPPGPVYLGRPAPGFVGVPVGHPFAQSQKPGVSSPPRGKPGAEPLKRPQSAPPPPPPVLEKRPSTLGPKERPPPPPPREGSKAAQGDRGGEKKDGGGGGGGGGGKKDQQQQQGKPGKQASQGGKPPPPQGGKPAKGGAKAAPAAKFTPWSFASSEPEFPASMARAGPASMSRTMLIAELDPPAPVPVPAPVPLAATVSTPSLAAAEEKRRGWTKVKRALTGGNFRRSGRKPKKLELDLGPRPDAAAERERMDMTPREIEMAGGGHGRRWDAPMSAGYNVPSVYAGMPGGSHYDLRTSTIGYFPGHFVASAVDVGAVGGLRGSRTLSGVKGGAW